MCEVSKVEVRNLMVIEVAISLVVLITVWLFENGLLSSSWCITRYGVCEDFFEKVCRPVEIQVLFIR